MDKKPSKKKVEPKKTTKKVVEVVEPKKSPRKRRVPEPEVLALDESTEIVSPREPLPEFVETPQEPIEDPVPIEPVPVEPTPIQPVIIDKDEDEDEDEDGPNDKTRNIILAAIILAAVVYFILKAYADN